MLSVSKTAFGISAWVHLLFLSIDTAIRIDEIDILFYRIARKFSLIIAWHWNCLISCLRIVLRIIFLWTSYLESLLPSWKSFHKNLYGILCRFLSEFTISDMEEEIIKDLIWIFMYSPIWTPYYLPYINSYVISYFQESHRKSHINNYIHIYIYILSKKYRELIIQKARTKRLSKTFLTLSWHHCPLYWRGVRARSVIWFVHNARCCQFISSVFRHFFNGLNFWPKTQRISSNNHRIHLICLRPTFFSFQNTNYHLEAPAFSRKMRLKNVLMIGLFVGMSLLFWEEPTLWAIK